MLENYKQVSAHTTDTHVTRTKQLSMAFKEYAWVIGFFFVSEVVHCLCSWGGAQSPAAKTIGKRKERQKNKLCKNEEEKKNTDEGG